MSTTTGLPLYVYNSTGNITLIGPYINNGSGGGTANDCVNLISNTLITDYDENSTSSSSASMYAQSYVKAIAHFVLLAAILDTAPAADVGSGNPNITLSISNINPTSPGSGWFVIITLSAGGKMSSTPLFATNPTIGGNLVFILSNYFQITSPGVFYMVTLEAFAMQTEYNVLVGPGIQGSSS